MSDNDLIIRVAARGDGVTADGRYVAGAAPGDTLSKDGGLIRGDHYQEPPCQHYELCGGCLLQHVDEESLGTFVSERAAYALSTQKIEPVQIMPVHLSPTHARRRVALRAGWISKDYHVGFSTEKSHRIIDLEQCDVMAPELFTMIEPLRHFLREQLGKHAQVQVKMAMTQQGIDLLIENWVAEGLAVHEALSAFAQEYKLARISIDEGFGPTTFFEPEPVSVQLSGYNVAYPPYGFLQATPDAEEALKAAVNDICADSNLVADLFCGLGTFALSLSKDKKVYAAEADQKAILALKTSAGLGGRQIFTEHRDLFRRPLEANELNKFEAIILDPPRAGAKDQAIRLADSDVPKIAYVSCNPNSFARDAKILIAGGYKLQRLWPVGQFRWSTHIEMVGEFIKA